MTTLTLNPNNKTGLGCLNGLVCPECNGLMVDTLSVLSNENPKNVKDCYCPMCEYTGKYITNTKTIIKK